MVDSFLIECFNQQDKCNNPIGSCLKNQIEDYYQSDLQKIEKGETPEYLVLSFVNINEIFS